MPPPDFGLIEIPAEKLLLFRTKSRKGNPEGRGILRNAYRDWYFKRRIQEIEGIGVERDLAGFPTLTAPEGMNIWDEDDSEMVSIRVAAERIVQNIRRDSLEGVVIPANWKLELLSTGGRRQFDTNAIIERYDTRIAMTVLADFVLLGHQNSGSWALSSDKTELFSMAKYQTDADVSTAISGLRTELMGEGVPEAYDTFKELSDYIEAHKDVSDALTAAIGDKVAKEDGKGLSSNDYTDEDKAKLAGFEIATDEEVAAALAEVYGEDAEDAE